MISVHIFAIVLALVAIGLFIWLRKQQQISDGLHAAELDHTHHGMNAMMDDFNNYQIHVDRELSKVEKQLEVQINGTGREIEKIRKDLPHNIRKVIGHIEFSQNNLRQMQYIYERNPDTGEVFRREKGNYNKRELINKTKIIWKK